MIFFNRCESDVANLVKRVMKAHHPELHKIEVVVDGVFAESDSGNAVMLHGYACAATIKKTSYKRRVLGSGDAELTIDKAWWDDAIDKQKEALIDHELTHLVPVIDRKTLQVKYDGAGRPKLSLRLHDWQMGGFEDTARRYGKDAPEVILARQFKEKFGQLCFDFIKGKDAQQ